MEFWFILDSINTGFITEYQIHCTCNIYINFKDRNKNVNNKISKVSKYMYNALQF